MNVSYLIQFAEASSHAEEGGVFAALGIDWKMLIFQIIGFLILVWVMGKFVYPVLMKVVDERQAKLDASAKAAAAAEAKAQSAEEDIKELLANAKKDAADIVATAHDEAATTISAAHNKAKATADLIVKNAHDQLDKDVAAARKALQNDTIRLVAQATEKVVGASITKTVDTSLIKKSIEDAK